MAGRRGIGGRGCLAGEDGLAGVGYALHGRSDNALRADRAKKAPVTRDVRKWASKA